MAVGVINFPASLDDLDTLIRAENNAVTTLASGITAGATTIPLVSATKFTTSGIATIIDNPASPTLIEIFTYTGKSSNDLTGAGRGAYGTTASAFSAGATVVMRPVARHHTALADAIIAIQTKLGISAHIKGYPKTIEVNTSTVGNAGTGLDDLHSFSLPAGSLAANGDYLEIEYGGNFASNNNDKRVVFSVGGSIHEDTGLFDVDALGWAIRARIIRLSATSVLVHSVFEAGILVIQSDATVANTAIGGRMNQRGGNKTVANLGSNAITLLVQAEGTADNDVTQYLTVIELVQR